MARVVLVIAAGVLYFVFVLPRWWELRARGPHTLGTAMRIVAGVLIGLAALPVVFTLLRTRKPEYGTPQLALTLRTWSIVLHVLAGVLIVGAAISEIWLRLDAAGQWLFGIYGAAAAIALLGALAFYLAYVAEMPPPPPKPLKSKAQKQRRGRGKRRGRSRGRRATRPTTPRRRRRCVVEEPRPHDDEADGRPRPPSADEAEPTKRREPDCRDASRRRGTRPRGTDEPTTTTEHRATNGKLRNRRPSGKDETTVVGAGVTRRGSRRRLTSRDFGQLWALWATSSVRTPA